MAKITIPMDLYLEAASVFHWATKRHYQLWFTGQEAKRHRRSESVLLRLVKKGKLRSVLYRSRLIYTLPKKVKKSGLEKVVHGLACTECLVRIYRGEQNGVAIAERYFHGLGCVPEWGIIYPDGKLLLLEFCTKSNYYYSGNMRGKMVAYRANLHKIEERFNGRAVVLFICDVDRSALKRDVGSDGGLPPSSDGDTFPDPFYFIDYKSFLSVPLGSTKWKEMCFYGS